MAQALALLLSLALAWGCAARGLHPLPVQQAALPAALPTPQPSATPAPQFPQSRPLDQKLPVKVRSARLRYDQSRKLTVFYGGVTVTHDTSTLLAQELRSSDQGANAEASGGVLVRDAQRQFTAEAGRLRYGNALQEGLLDDGVHMVTVGPYGRAVTITGQSGGYQGLSRSAWVDGKVWVHREGLSVSAQRAEVEDGGADLRLLRDVDVRLDGNHAQADGAELRREGQSLELSGSVRARFVPAELKQAAAQPWRAGDDKEAP